MAPPFPSATRNWHSNSYPSISPTRPELSASGKTILITGGGTGIGAETARSFAAAGASKIALLGRRIQPLLDTKRTIEKEFGPRVHVFVASTDITKKEEVDKAFEDFTTSAPRDDHEIANIDVLVSNAAATGPMEGVEDVDADAFIESVSANLKGALYIAQAFSRHAAGNAVIIDVNSMAAYANFGPRFAAYSIAKLAVYRLWDALGSVNSGFSVYHTQPGVVDTDMNRAAGGVKAMGYEDHVSLPANFHVWLASPEARFLKGKFLYASWDVEELKARAEELAASRELTIGHVGWPFDSNEGEINWDA
ncbi:SDR family NAD(P)-dependent oxidoreductase [Aspergillus foveolatus]|uniref:SDR family NAD(P)-dependent oxidoreductase n=1 Tax=Aspergillus foveolatus TaxID=210207 RepID=UPI003CCCAE2A